MFYEKAVPRQRSFPISDILSFGILSTSVHYCTPIPLVGPNQSEISNFYPISNITQYFVKKQCLDSVVSLFRTYQVLESCQQVLIIVHQTLLLAQNNQKFPIFKL